MRASSCLRLLIVLVLALASAVAQTSNQPLRVFEEFDHLEPHGFDWMIAYRNKPTTELVKDPRFADVEKFVSSVEKVKYDFDGPGTQVLLRDKFNEVLAGTSAGPATPENVSLRLGRYLTAANCSGNGCQTGAFLWVDTVEGVALCVLVNPPTPELPSKGPAILIYSRQLQMKMKVIKEADLPSQFWFDFHEWAFEKQLSQVMTQRYVNGFNAVQVLLHDEDFCQSAYSTYDSETCNQQAQDAADADLQALVSQIGEHQKDDKTAQVLLKDANLAWKDYRDKACKAAYNQFAGGTFAPVAEGECSVRLTKERVHGLQTDYFVMLFD